MGDVRQIQTRKGPITFPAYIPVTTFGKKYPLDDLVRPYLPRLAPAVMVSHFYAKQQDRPLRIPMLVDSGGFVSLFEKARILERNGLGLIELETENGIDQIHPSEVLEFQEQVADIAFTLDFPIPPGMDPFESEKRLNLTIKNALWALRNRRRRDLPLYACIQGWDIDSYLACAKSYVNQKFDGIAIGGLVPRSRNKEFLKNLVTRTRDLVGNLPIHVFGIGNPDLVELLFLSGADSVDSSSYVRMAAEGRMWANKIKITSPTATQRLHLALCNLANATQKNLPLSTSQHILCESLNRP